MNRGWLVLSAIFLGAVVLLRAGGRLVALVPLIGGVALLWRRDKVRPRTLPWAVAAVAVLYSLGLVVALLPIDLGSPGLVLAAMGLDLAVLGYLVAVADAVDSGERLLPDLRRAAVSAVAARWCAAVSPPSPCWPSRSCGPSWCCSS